MDSSLLPDPEPPEPPSFSVKVSFFDGSSSPTESFILPRLVPPPWLVSPLLFSLSSPPPPLTSTGLLTILSLHRAYFRPRSELVSPSSPSRSLSSLPISSFRDAHSPSPLSSLRQVSNPYMGWDLASNHLVSCLALSSFVSTVISSLASMRVITAGCRSFPNSIRLKLQIGSQIWSPGRVKNPLSIFGIRAPVSLLVQPLFRLSPPLPHPLDLSHSRDFNLPLPEPISSLCVSTFVVLCGTSSALVRSFIAVCSPRSVFVLAPSDIMIQFLSLWRFEGLYSDISSQPVNLVSLGIYCPAFSPVEFDFLPSPPLVLSGFVAGSIMADALASVQFQGSAVWYLVISAFVVGISIDNCALVAVSIAGFRSLKMFTNSQSIISLPSFFGIEFRGLLGGYSCLCVMVNSICLLYAFCSILVANVFFLGEE